MRHEGGERKWWARADWRGSRERYENSVFEVALLIGSFKTGPMFIKHTAVFARLLGVAINTLTVCATALCVSWICGNAYGLPWWALPILLAVVSLAAVTFNGMGDYLWSLEEGWFGLQRMFWVVQVTLIAGGLLVTWVCQVYYSIVGY